MVRLHQPKNDLTEEVVFAKDVLRWVFIIGSFIGSGCGRRAALTGDDAGGITADTTDMDKVMSCGMVDSVQGCSCGKEQPHGEQTCRADGSWSECECEPESSDTVSQADIPSDTELETGSVTTSKTDTANGTASEVESDSATASESDTRESLDSEGIDELADIVCVPEQDCEVIQFFAPEKRQTVSGLNGTFIDECDEHGDLVEYSCDYYREWDLNYLGNVETGDVTANTIDCGGSCHEGACVSQCPRVGDIITYLAIADDAAMLRNETQGQDYKCVLEYVRGGDYNCHDDPEIGVAYPVDQEGHQHTLCVEEEIFQVTLEYCFYKCQHLNDIRSNNDAGEGMDLREISWPDRD
jgi:hypothetical protein